MSATCPYCRTAFAPDDEIIACPGCNTEHHADCLQENGGCTIFGCSQAPAEEPKISVSPQDLTPPVSRPPVPPSNPGSIFNLSAPPADPEPVTARPAPTPPPPRPDGSSAPPPPPAPYTYYNQPTYPGAGSYMPYTPSAMDSYEPRKSRVVFVLLAVFLGAFGGHNFYAGYIKKAVIQLCLTAFTCFAGALISWPWAIVEACIINRDDDGVAFV